MPLTPYAARAAGVAAVAATMDRLAASRDEIALNASLLAKILDLKPHIASPRFYDPPNVGVSSTSRCWVVKLLDQFNRPREGFLRGPDTITDAAAHANSIFKNWTILSITPTSQAAPPSSAGPVPAVASEYGVMKSLDARRLR